MTRRYKEGKMKKKIRAGYGGRAEEVSGRNKVKRRFFRLTISDMLGLDVRKFCRARRCNAVSTQRVCGIDLWRSSDQLPNLLCSYGKHFVEFQIIAN
ncbi:hypothetical protein RRG08_059723 [Elysia crispata]|uniref:Uncharacterized protein n=1 Tax=Elysia crispata TaxID=231223 RepID=A0AAE0YNK6_9GAST|nr:hypothetical protein RRG08_059723 [Elysia crispata]